MLPGLVFAVVAGAVVAVMVAVVITVAVVAVSAVYVGSVEKDGHVLIAVLVVVFLNVGKFILFQKAGAYHEESHVGEAVDDLCIGYDFDRRAVDDDVVVLCAQIVDEIVELTAGK